MRKSRRYTIFILIQSDPVEEKGKIKRDIKQCLVQMTACAFFIKHPGLFGEIFGSSISRYIIKLCYYRNRALDSL